VAGKGSGSWGLKRIARELGDGKGSGSLSKAYASDMKKLAKELKKSGDIQ